MGHGASLHLFRVASIVRRMPGERVGRRGILCKPCPYRNECRTVGLKIPLPSSELGVTAPLGLSRLLQYLGETVERGLYLRVERRAEGAGTLRKPLLEVSPQAPGVAVQFL